MHHVYKLPYKKFGIKMIMAWIDIDFYNLLGCVSVCIKINWFDSIKMFNWLMCVEPALSDHWIAWSFKTGGLSWQWESAYIL